VKRKNMSSHVSGLVIEEQVKSVYGASSKSVHVSLILENILNNETTTCDQKFEQVLFLLRRTCGKDDRLGALVCKLMVDSGYPVTEKQLHQAW
jgi:copper chaperone CopZ